MKRITIIVFLIFFAAGLKAQIINPVKWSYGSKKINANEAVVFIKASIQPGWHIYSQYVKEGGPIPTSFTYSPSKDYVLNGKSIEPKSISKYEETFGMNVNYFENSVVFQQKIKLNVKTATVKGKLEFMVCNDKQCLPPDEIAFAIPVK